jgi:hypothetical protein
MKSHIALALIAAASFAAQAEAGQKYAGAWWSGVKYSEGRFEPGKSVSGRPPLVSHAEWKAEKTAKGTLIRVNKAEDGFLSAGYLTADEKGAVGVTAKPGPGSYWAMKEGKTERGYYDKPKEDWKGKWSRTSYALEPLAKGLKGGKLGFRGGKLTVHPKNKGMAILSETLIDAEEVSGK